MQQTSSQYFRTIKILQLALVAGQVVFSVISLVLAKDRGLAEGAELTPVFHLIVPALTIAGIAGSILLFRMKVKQAAAETDLQAKMAAYRTAWILKYAMLEGPSLFAIVAYLLTGFLGYLAAPVILIVLSLMQRPDHETAVNDLELDYQEQMRLGSPDDPMSPYQDNVQ